MKEMVQFDSNNRKMKKMMMKLIVLVAVSMTAIQAQAKFCPLEKKDNFQCRSRPNSFKCGAFFENLPGSQTEENGISWIAAMPDLLSKKSTRENEEFLLSFGIPPTRQSFLFTRAEECSEVSANSRCYTYMIRASESPLQSCKATILNEEGKVTIGEELCRRASIHTNADSINNIDVGFYFSACGGPWTPVNNRGQPLKIREKICCQRQNGVLRYRPCNGQPFTPVQCN